MIEQQKFRHYKFNLALWLSEMDADQRSPLIDKICAGIQQGNQGRYTIKRIRYMKQGDNSYVRPETKKAICDAFGKDVSEFETTPVLLTSNQREFSSHNIKTA